MPGGRPTVYEPKYCEMLIDHMEQGLSFESFAGVVGTCRSTLYNWADSHPEFLDAKSRGRDLNLLTWEKMFAAKARGLPQAKDFDRTCIIFKMKCLGWREADEEKADINVKLSYNLDED